MSSDDVLGDYFELVFEAADATAEVDDFTVDQSSAESRNQYKLLRQVERDAHTRLIAHIRDNEEAITDGLQRGVDSASEEPDEETEENGDDAGDK